MRPAFYAEQWADLKSAPDRQRIESLSQRVASTFVDRYFYSDEYNSEYINLLCEMATCFEDPALNQIASGALFSIVIERLCDDFEELQTETYNRLICQVVDFLRKLPQGSELDTALNDFDLKSEAQLYHRIEDIRLRRDQELPLAIKPRKVIILSRVTIGADVAITSVICQRIRHEYPEASVKVAGNAKLREVFPESSSIGILELNYARRGGLLDRFLVWLDLLSAVNRELADSSDNEFLVLDPDSRLTQLGVLPLVADRNYRFFNSRGKQDYPVKASISELTNLWLDAILGHERFCYPKVWLDEYTNSRALSFLKCFDLSGDSKVIVLNFGVGGNHRKLIDGSFEAKLVLALLSETDTRIVLDLGFGAEEKLRGETILAAASKAGFRVQARNFQKPQQAAEDVRLVGVECSVAEIAALISQCDEFIGYDSACQHVAAALGVRTFTVFAGTNNVRFIRRWHACGPNLSEIVYVDTITRERETEPDEVIERLMDLRHD